MSAARQYPSLQPIQKERFEQRLRDWTAMTPDQRKAARETFQGMRKLPPEKQHELRERWFERHQDYRQQDYPSSRPQQQGYPMEQRQQRFEGGSSYPHYRDGGRRRDEPRDTGPRGG